MRFPICITLLLLAGTGNAKCVGKAGETIYTDGRCEDAGGKWVGAPVDREKATDDAMRAVERAERRLARIKRESEATSPPERLALIRRCEGKWPADYAMQKHCMDKQSEAAQYLSLIAGSIKGIPVLESVMSRCGETWIDGDTFDFTMVKHCYDQQIEAMDAIESAKGR